MNMVALKEREMLLLTSRCMPTAEQNAPAQALIRISQFRNRSAILQA